MRFTKIVLSSLLLMSFILLMQSCTTETKANQAKSNKTNANAKSNKGVLVPISTATSNNSLKWYSIEEVEQLQAKAPKKVIVDVYTNWCKWCKVMDQKTFTDQALIQYLNQNYYMVKFNAELKTEVTFKGTKYSYQSNGKRGYNTLTPELIKGRLSYPSFVVLDENLNHLKITQGYKNATQFKQALQTVNAI